MSQQSPNTQDVPKSLTLLSLLDFANFDNFPVAMDTSGSGGDSWAKFDDIASKAEPTSTTAGEQNWADFSSFDDIANSPTDPKSANDRSLSPIAMDTADDAQNSAASRMAQYSKSLLLLCFLSLMLFTKPKSLQWWSKLQLKNRNRQTRQIRKFTSCVVSPVCTP